VAVLFAGLGRWVRSGKGFDRGCRVWHVKARVKATDNPQQGTFGFLRALVIDQGDGTFLVRPGKPVLKLTPEEFGREVGLSRNAIYSRIQDGSIPQESVEYAGPRKLYIHSTALDTFRAVWRRRRAEES